MTIHVQNNTISSCKLNQSVSKENYVTSGAKLKVIIADIEKGIAQ